MTEESRQKRLEMMRLAGVRTVIGDSEFKQIVHVCRGLSLLVTARTLLSWRDGSR